MQLSSEHDLHDADARAAQLRCDTCLCVGRLVHARPVVHTAVQEPMSRVTAGGRWPCGACVGRQQEAFSRHMSCQCRVVLSHFTRLELFTFHSFLSPSAAARCSVLLTLFPAGSPAHVSCHRKPCQTWTPLLSFRKYQMSAAWRCERES